MDSKCGHSACLPARTSSIYARRPLHASSPRRPCLRQDTSHFPNSCHSHRYKTKCSSSAKAEQAAADSQAGSSPRSTLRPAADWDPDDYMNSYDSDDYDDATYFQLQSRREVSQHTTLPQLFTTSADRRAAAAQGQRKLELEAAIAEVHPLVTSLVFVWRRFWFRIVKVCQVVSIAPLETYRAVNVTGTAAKDVVQQLYDDSVQRFKNAVDEAKAVAERSRAKADLLEDRPCPEDFWGKVQWWWERPQLKRMRTTVSMAQWSVKLPAIMALVATQVGLLASSVSLPMLAPLLLGTGMLFRSIKSNASYLFPRISLVVVLMWVLWFANSVVQNTVHYLQRQGALDHRISAAIITGSELFTMVGAGVIVLSALGVNVSGLLLPAGVCLAIASKDLAHNFLAGFFLFAVQPFRTGDRIAVRSQASGESAVTSPAPAPGWYEGTCEAVDLRYTIIKNGRQRLFMPNSQFLTKEFMVMEHEKPRRSSKRSKQPSPPVYGPPPQPDMTRPLGPGRAYGRWGEELERQRMLAASRRVSNAGQATTPQHGSQTQPDEQLSAQRNGNGHGPTAANDLNGTQAHQAAADDDEQHDDMNAYPNPYQGIPGYYSYGAYPGMQYDPTLQEQFWYDYNGYHPYWRQAGSRDDNAVWEEHEANE